MPKILKRLFVRPSLILLYGCLSGGTALAADPVSFMVDSFEPTGTRGFSYSGGKIGSVWSNWFGGAFQSLAWDGATDVAGSATSGSMKIMANFSGSNNQFTVINGFNGISPSVSARQFTALECDIRFAPGSASYLRNGSATFGNVEFGMATPGYGQLYFGGVYVPASETGWVHVTIPLNPATNPNLYKINNVMVHIWGGSSLSGASTLWVDNLKFTGSTVSDTATVNYATGRQMIDGFGASSAWISSWTTAEADLFFSTGPNGVGLSLLRSRITPEGTTWEANIMKMAQDRGARVWSTPWSPPPNLKTSNSAIAGSFISSPANYQTYANQLANYVQAMKNNQGVNLHALSIQNEPNYETDYESCLWTAAQFHEFVPYLHAALIDRGVGSTKIMLPECAQWNFALASDTMNDPASASKVGILGGHNYGSSAAAVTQFGSPAPVPLWQTEHYFGASADVSITNGLAVAEQIHDFMTVAEANAYHYWWLKGSGSGSIAGNSTVTPAKRLYVMGNYSKFVRPGFQRVTVSSNTTALISAYKNPASLDFVIVAANPTAWPVTQTFNLAGCPTVTSLDRWVTSDTLSLSSQAAVNVTAGVFTAVLPPFTVTTYKSVSATSPVIPLKTNDSFGNTSFNSVGNWDDTVPPTSAKDYTVQQYALRTPPVDNHFTFGGHSLTIPAQGSLKFKGANNNTITIGSLILAGGTIDNGNDNTLFNLAGSMSVTADSFIYPAADAFRTIHIASELDGNGSLTCGNGGPGTVSFSGPNDAFTGSIIVNGGCVLKAASQSNLGGNPAVFRPGLLTLDNGIFQPTASFEMNHANGGIILGAGGGTFSINSGLTLTIANPVGGTGGLVKSGPGALVVHGAGSYNGTTNLAEGALTVDGLGGSGAVVTAGGTHFGGSGVIVGDTTINGILIPSAAGLTFQGSLAFGSTGKVGCQFDGNSLESAGMVSASSVAVSMGTQLDVLLDGPASTTNFLHSFWRSPRSIPVITGGSMTGVFALGTVSGDSDGRPASTYGSFTLQHTGTGLNLVWTPIPGFPSVDDPTVVITSPVDSTVSLPVGTLDLRATATVTGGESTVVTWTQVSGPGSASFLNPSAADTQVSFPSDGTYVLRCTASNVLGDSYQEVTVLVGPFQTKTFREGVNEYAHAGTIIRGDLTGMNSGARDQIVVGRNGGPLRGLLSFDISQIPQGAGIESVTLDLWLVSAGSGLTLNTIELHKLLTTFIEGSGDGISASNGAGTGADWNTRTGNGADPWSAPGSLAGTDYDASSIASIAGFQPVTTTVGTKFTLGSTSAMVAAVGEIAGTSAPLGLMLKMAGDTSGGNMFARFGSDNHATLAQRPLLTVGYSFNRLPSVVLSPAPDPQTGEPASIGGSTVNATHSVWSLVSGPGSATFADASQASTTVIFDQPGDYVLRLSAVNAHGETSSTMLVTAQDLTPPELALPANIIEEATGASGAVVSFTTSALDAVSGNCPTINTPPSGSLFPLGSTTVNTTASDAAGNQVASSFTITVRDTTPPEISVPAPISVRATSSSGAPVSFSSQASDLVDGTVSTSSSPASGSMFPIGTTNVSVSATDAAGNLADASLSVTVEPYGFASWADSQFSAEELADPHISGPKATPAHDGISNLMKYALGLPAKTPSTTGVSIQQSESAWDFIYQRPADRPDITYAVEASIDMNQETWSTSGVVLERIATGEIETWRGRVTTTSEEARAFLRLTVRKP